MRALIFGKNGQVARMLAEEASAEAHPIVLGSAEADLSAPGAAIGAIDAHQPEIIINAAAYTAVDKAEDERIAAEQLNAGAVAEIAAKANDIDAPFLHISTDYVFDGASDSPYREDDAVAPLNAYGSSKLNGEQAALAANPQSIILRTSWVFSEYGGNFVKTMLKLAQNRNALDVVSDQIGGPTSARDIARALWMIAGKKYRGAPGDGVYHFQSAPATSWADFARKIFEITGADMTVSDIATAAYQQKFPQAARPLNTVLDCSRIERDFGIAQPDWRSSLRQVIKALENQGTHP